jgi:hypothetical protein
MGTDRDASWGSPQSMLKSPPPYRYDKHSGGRRSKEQ